MKLHDRDPDPLDALLRAAGDVPPPQGLAERILRAARDPAALKAAYWREVGDEARRALVGSMAALAAAAALFMALWLDAAAVGDVDGPAAHVAQEADETALDLDRGLLVVALAPDAPDGLARPLSQEWLLPEGGEW